MQQKLLFSLSLFFVCTQHGFEPIFTKRHAAGFCSGQAAALPAQAIDFMSTTPDAPHVRLPILEAVQLQDSLLGAVHDLERLEALLSHASDTLLQRFGDAHDFLGSETADADAFRAEVRAALHAAVTELQFHDMASQLIAHTAKVLRVCAFRLAAETMESAEDGSAAPAVLRFPERPNPVTQSEMDAGSIDLF